MKGLRSVLGKYRKRGMYKGEQVKQVIGREVEGREKGRTEKGEPFYAL